MKEQRWPGDYQTVPQEFASSRAQEDVAMRQINESFEHDYLAMGISRHVDQGQMNELEPSFTTQLDTVGMQPHAREYVERQSNCMRSERKFEMIAGQMIDYTPGIQFSGRP